MSKKDRIIELVGDMTVLELSKLTKSLEEKYGVTGQQVIQVQAPVEEEKEQDEFAVVLKSYGEKKIPIIQAVRAITGLGLKNSRDLVIQAPVTIIKGLSKEEADGIQRKLEGLGATVEIK